MRKEKINFPLIRPIPQEQESPGGFLLRFSELNGWINPDKFLSGYGVLKPGQRFYPLFFDEHKWNLTCSRLGVINKSEYKVIYSKCIYDKKLGVEFLENNIPRNDISFKCPAICPLCIELKKYIPKLWDHKLISFCSIHKIELIESCGKCKRKLSWQRLGLNKCKCGFNYKESKFNQINITSLRLIEKIIINKCDVKLSIISNYYDVFKQFFKFIEVKVCNNQLSEFSVLAYIDNSYIKNIVIFEACKLAESKGCHPRITLHPFLVSKIIEINKFGSNILKTFDLDIDLYIKKKSNLNQKFTIAQKPLLKLLGIGCTHLKVIVKNENIKTLNTEIYFQSLNNYFCSFMSKLPKKYSSKTINEIISGQNYKDQYNIIKMTKLSWKFFSGFNKNYTISDLSGIVDTFDENIKYLVYKGIIKTCNEETNKVYIERLEVLRVLREYIFEEDISKEFGECPEIFYKKFKGFGIQPVSGPNVDAAYIYVYKREDLNNIKLKDFQNSKIKYKKKQIDLRGLDGHCIPSFRVMRKLDMRFHEIKGLVNDKVLKVDKVDYNEIYITKESFVELCYKINNNCLFTLKGAASSIGLTRLKFYLNLVQNGIVKKYNNGSALLFSFESIKKETKFRKKHMVLNCASKLLNKDINYLLCLEQLGLLTSTRKIPNDSHEIIYFCRKDINHLKKNMIDIV